MKILFLTLGLPWPADRGARIRDFNLIKQVSQYHDVFLLALLDPTGQSPDTAELEPYCQWIETVEMQQRTVLDHMKSIGSSIYHGRPLAVYDLYRQELAKNLQIAVSRDIDVVQFEHSFFAPYINALPDDFRGKTVLDFHNVGFLQYQRMAELELGTREKAGFQIKSVLMQGWESRYAKRFHHCLATSDTDASVLRRQAPDLKVTVIPNGIDTGNHQLLDTPQDGATLLIIGTIGYPPNSDSAIYFANEIMPLIERQIPEAALIIAGHAPPEKVINLDRRNNIDVLGTVPDVLPVYQQSQITVVPLRGGGGTRLKIIESMALGRPVVTTSIGCEGLDVEDGTHLLIADSPADFAGAVIKLLQDHSLRARIITNARKLVESRYDWDMIGKKLVSVYKGFDQEKGYSS